MAYLTAAQLKARVKTNLAEEALADVINEASALINQRLGTEPKAQLETMLNTSTSTRTLWLPFAPARIISATVTYQGETEEVDPLDVEFEGRCIMRRGTREYRKEWRGQVKIVFDVKDFEGIQALIRGVCIDLCRIQLTDMGAISNQSIGKTSRSSKDVQEEIRKVLSRLTPLIGIRPVMAR